jgi:hypothetical protein
MIIVSVDVVWLHLHPPITSTLCLRLIPVPSRCKFIRYNTLRYKSSLSRTCIQLCMLARSRCPPWLRTERSDVQVHQLWEARYWASRLYIECHSRSTLLICRQRLIPYEYSSLDRFWRRWWSKVRESATARGCIYYRSDTLGGWLKESISNLEIGFGIRRSDHL